MSFTLFDKILLYQLKGMGLASLNRILKEAESFSQICKWSDREFTRFKYLQNQSIPEQLKSLLKNTDLIKLIESSIDEADKVITFWDNDYPSLLKQVHSPPVFLFCKGNINLLNQNSFALVGTRYPSGYGIAQAKQFTQLISEQNIVTVSGLARGIDTIVHRTSVNLKRPTIAVIGTGLDITYPGENKQLVNQIIDADGLIVTEFLNKTKPDMQNFPKRNRIISGLSKGVLVVEAGLKSGAILTAKIALEQNRDVFAIPGHIDSEKSRGCHNLIKQGAKLVESLADILDELQFTERFATQTSIFDKNQLSKSELDIFELLKDELHIDEIADQLDRPIHGILADLLNLEMRRIIKQVEGKRFSRLV